MALKSCHIIILAFLSLAAVAAPISAGGWRRIDKPNSILEVVHAAKFAVENYNESQHKFLDFVSVVKGEELPGAVTQYRLIIAAKDGEEAAAGNYRAVVSYMWEEKRLQVVSFQKTT
ncbi:hypothetical protein C2S53_017713 [Perilla frutescens var. hirtella]|uniref:Cystatin domain-containing protein n=1 Tax=Perilla frutescens var. hirtella TaxID=608512 RepID=A0AAD4P109_PERFH|nr:hypothetical protein C2S53_017713 [Perilla frutescens var. hirtella]